MKKGLLALCLCIGINKLCQAQTKEVLEKAHKDPATNKRSAKADVLLIDKYKIMENDSHSGTSVSAAGRNKKSCNKMQDKKKLHAAQRRSKQR